MNTCLFTNCAHVLSAAYDQPIGDEIEAFAHYVLTTNFQLNDDALFTES